MTDVKKLGSDVVLSPSKHVGSVEIGLGRVADHRDALSVGVAQTSVFLAVKVRLCFKAALVFMELCFKILHPNGLGPVGDISQKFGET